VAHDHVHDSTEELNLVQLWSLGQRKPRPNRIKLA